MAGAGDATNAGFDVLCPHCARGVRARPAWCGRDVECPHCGGMLRVPPPPDPGAPAVHAVAGDQHGRRFSFGCPRCASLLESELAQTGATARCPTCGARLVIPTSDGWGTPQARLIDSNDQDPTPMHAYAASGAQAPHIHRTPDDRLEIECPRCGARSAITVNNCVACGVPFSIDGVPTVRPPVRSSLATAALVVGLIALPLSRLFVFGIAALLLALASWITQGRATPCARAIVGALLGLVSLGIAIGASL